MHKSGKTNETQVAIETEGGELSVHFDLNDGYTNVHLVGPAKQVFKGEISC